MEEPLINNNNNNNNNNNEYPSFSTAFRRRAFKLKENAQKLSNIRCYSSTPRSTTTSKDNGNNININNNNNNINNNNNNNNINNNNNSINTSTTSIVMHRHLGVCSLMITGVGSCVGAGIFVLVGVASSQTGPAVVLSFCVAAIPCIFNALCYAELVSRFPYCGSVFLYTYITFGEIIALIIIMNILIDYHFGAAIIARSFAEYLYQFLIIFLPCETCIPRWLKIFEFCHISFSILGPCFIVLIGFLLSHGSQASNKIIFFCTGVSMLVILMVIGFGSFDVNTDNWDPFIPLGKREIFSTAGLVFYSYVGFDAVVNLVEEAKNPLRDIPLAILGSLTICTSLYVALSLVLTGLIPYMDIDPTAPLAHAFNHTRFKWLQPIVSVGTLGGLFSVLLIGFTSQSRVYLSIARDGLLPKFLAKIHPTYQCPTFAIYLCSFIAFVLALLFNVKSLSNMLSIGVLSGYLMVCGAVLVQRATRKQYISNHFFILVFVSFFTAIVLQHIEYVDAKYHIHLNIILPSLTILSAIPLVLYQGYRRPHTFCSPFVPIFPILGIWSDVYIISQLDFIAYIRYLLVILIVFVSYLYLSYQDTKIKDHDRLLGQHEEESQSIEQQQQQDSLMNSNSLSNSYRRGNEEHLHSCSDAGHNILLSTDSNHICSSFNCSHSIGSLASSFHASPINISNNSSTHGKAGWSNIFSPEQSLGQRSTSDRNHSSPLLSRTRSHDSMNIRLLGGGGAQEEFHSTNKSEEVGLLSEDRQEYDEV